MPFIVFLVLQVVVFCALMFFLRRMLSRNLTDAAAHLQGLSAEYTRRQEVLKKRVEQTEQQRMLHRRLQEKLGRELTMTEAADARLVSGLVITLGSVVLDGSLASKVKQAARHAQHAA